MIKGEHEKTGSPGEALGVGSQAVEAEMTKVSKNIIAGGIGLLKWIIGLILLAVVGVLLYRLYAPAEWGCRLDTGTLIYTDGKPSGEWVEDRDGRLYPRDRIEECIELADQ